MPAPTEPVVNEKRKIPDDEWEFTSVVLEKSSTRQGFGIAISGGKDNPHFKTGDTSILVTDIIKGSPADGTLRIGDKLISVNDKMVDGGSHKDAVLALKAAGMQARMQIKRPGQKKPPPKIIETSSPDLEPALNSTPKGSVKSDNDRGRDQRKRPKEMELESGDRGRSRGSKNKENEDENGEKPRRRSRSTEEKTDGEEKPRRHRSKSREKDENGEERPRRHRSKSREKGEDGEEKPRRHRSKSREKQENGEEEKPHVHRSKSRDKGEDGEKRVRRSKGKDKPEAEPAAAVEHAVPIKSPTPVVEASPVVETPPVVEEPIPEVQTPVVEAAPAHIEIPPSQPAQEVESPKTSTSDETDEKAASGEKKRHHSKSRSKEEGENKGEKRRSRSRGREPEVKDEEPRAGRSRSRGRSKSRDDLTRSKSKESLHRSKSKSRDQLSGAPPGSELQTVVLERGNQGYGFSLGQQIFIRDMANDSPAAKADNFDKGDIVHEINGTRVDNLKVSECIEIIRAATEQLTITLIKKPKEIKPIEEAKPEKKRTKPRPTEAPEAKHVPEKQPEIVVENVVPVEDVPVEAAPVYEEPPREATPPPEEKPDLNETSDSWAQASPEKQEKIEPTQEMEHMDAKLERLKAGRRFETRMSQLPNARVISFHKTGSVGIQVAGGNSLGIFVAAIRDDSAAAKEGLKPGDQILMCNEIDFEDITREEAVLILLALPDDVSLVVESKKDTFDQIKKELGDNFFIRVNFDHSEKTNQNELTFRKGEIFNVRDTMYQGLIGYWQAQRVGKNAQMLERGVLPNKSRAEQLAIAQKMEDRQASMPGRAKVKRRPSLSSTLKKHKFVSQDRLDESSFADSVQIPAYERVVLKIADFMRPVVILGALGDLVRLKLLEEMPDRFDVPTPMDLGGGTDTSSYDNAIKISEIRNVIVKNKHCLLDITPEGIEMLMYAQLCPIVILLKSTSRGAVKEMRAHIVTELKNSPTGVGGFDGDPSTAKQVKKVFSNAKKLEEFYPHIFTAKINTHIAGAEALSMEFYYKLKEIIFAQQAQSAWMPEEKPQEMLEDVVFHPPNYASYLSGADSDTEGESMTSSPVMAKKHYEDEEEEEEESPPSPVNDAAFLPSPDPVPEPEAKKHREKSKDRTPREKSKDRTPREKSKDRRHEGEGEDRDHRKHRKSKRKPEAPDSPEEPTRDVERVSPILQTEPSIGMLEELIVSATVEDELEQEPEQLSDHSIDHRDHPPTVNGYADDYLESPPSPRSYRDPPSVSQEVEDAVDEYESEFVYGRGEPEPTEDIPVLRDPNYSLPRPVPDSPPSRRPPEVKAKPLNSIKVMPSELGNVTSLEEKRRSLKPIPGPDDDPLLAFAESGHVNGLEEMAHTPSPRLEEESDLPPSRPPPPPEREEVPTKVLTLKERMSKLQSKVGSPPSPVAKPAPPPVEEEPAPPARPAAPRNYINDMRYRGGPKKDLYAQNIVTPSPEYPEITRIQKPVVEKPFTNDSASNLESTPDSPSEGEPIVIATARGLFDHRGGLLESVETNVSIFIPYGALPEGKKEEIYFKVCQDSKHMPPLDSRSGETLLSPLVMCGPHGLKFRKPIELRLPHKGASNDSMAFSLKSSDSPVGHPGDWRNVKLGDSDLDGGRAYQVTDDTVSVLVDHF